LNRFKIEQLLKEAEFRFSRSSGKGGQNVNKVETKVELIFNVTDSEMLDDVQKEKIIKRLASRIDREGNLRIVSQTGRTQLSNRKNTVDKFVKLVFSALRKEKKRIKTERTLSSRVQVLEKKKKHSEKKRVRSFRDFILE
jgi:ribosome-associated protein